MILCTFNLNILDWAFPNATVHFSNFLKLSIQVHSDFIDQPSALDKI
jgi:hypothetical protein